MGLCPFSSFSLAPQPVYVGKPAPSLLPTVATLAPGTGSHSCQVNAFHTRVKTGEPGFSSSFSKATNWSAPSSDLPFKLSISVTHSDTHLSEATSWSLHILTALQVLCLSKLSLTVFKKAYPHRGLNTPHCAVWVPGLLMVRTEDSSPPHPPPFKPRNIYRLLQGLKERVWRPRNLRKHLAPWYPAVPSEKWGHLS